MYLYIGSGIFDNQMHEAWAKDKTDLGTIIPHNCIICMPRAAVYDPHISYFIKWYKYDAYRLGNAVEEAVIYIDGKQTWSISTYQEAIGVTDTAGL